MFSLVKTQIFLTIKLIFIYQINIFELIIKVTLNLMVLGNKEKYRD